MFDYRDAEASELWRGPYGALTPAARVGNHYYGEGPDLPAVPDHDLGAMDTRAQRLAILAGMRQDGDPTNPLGDAQCGASALMAAAVYGGGAGGVTAMIDAAEKFEQRRPGEAPPPGDAGMDALKARLANGEHLTSADLQMMQSSLYGALGGDDGLEPETLAKFIQGSPAIAKMFKGADMHLETIAPDGGAVGKHCVLGFGHEGGRLAGVFNPQARAMREEDAEGRRTTAQNADGSFRLDSQVVTDWNDVKDYEALMRQEIDARGLHGHYAE